jgi:hypothetical protein
LGQSPSRRLSWGNGVVPAPDLESYGQYQQENYKHQQRLKPFNDGNQIHPNTRRVPALLADKHFGFLFWPVHFRPAEKNLIININNFILIGL